MTVTAPTLDSITGNTVMVKMRELIKQMTAFAKEVADLVNTIPTDIQDTYSREAIDGMIDDIDDAIMTLSDSVYTKEEVYTKNEVNILENNKQDKLIAGNNITIESNVISATGSGTGGMILLASGTLANADSYLPVVTDEDGLYIINVPDYGGTYVAVYSEDVYSSTFMTTQKQAQVTFQGGSASQTYIGFTVTHDTTNNKLKFRIAEKSTDIYTGTWTNPMMKANTEYEIYYLPIINTV